MLTSLNLAREVVELRETRVGMPSFGAAAAGADRARRVGARHDDARPARPADRLGARWRRPAAPCGQKARLSGAEIAEQSAACACVLRAARRREPSRRRRPALAGGGPGHLEAWPGLAGGPRVALYASAPRRAADPSPLRGAAGSPGPRRLLPRIEAARRLGVRGRSRAGTRSAPGGALRRARAPRRRHRGPRRTPPARPGARAGPGLRCSGRTNLWAAAAASTIAPSGRRRRGPLAHAAPPSRSSVVAARCPTTRTIGAWMRS